MNHPLFFLSLDLLDCNMAFYSQEALLVMVNSVAELQHLDEDAETAYWLDVCNYDATTLLTIGKVGSFYFFKIFFLYYEIISSSSTATAVFWTSCANC